MLPTRRSVIHPETVFALTPACLQALLVAAGAPRVIANASDGSLAFARTLFEARLSPPAADWLDLAGELAGRFGARAILEAADDLGLDTRAWQDEIPEDLAALVVTRMARGDSDIERLVERARIRLARFLPDRIGYELTAPDGKRLDAAAFASALASIPGIVDPPWVGEDAGGTLHAAVLWAEGRRAFVEVVGPGIQRCEMRLLRADIVRLDFATGRVTVTSADPSRIACVAEALARGGFGDGRGLARRPAFTLEPLLQMGAEGLAKVKLPGPTKSVEVVACQRIALIGGRDEVRAPDALAQIEVRTRTLGGYFSRVTLRFVIAGARAAVDAYIELPNKIGIREPRWTPELRAALTVMGILSPGAIGDDVTMLVTEPQWAWRWTEVAGEAAFRRMVESGLLVPQAAEQGSGALSEATRLWGHSLRSYPLTHPFDAATRYALADDWLVRARTVQEAEPAAYRLDVATLRAVVGRDLGLSDGSPVELPSGVVDLGVHRTARTTYRMSYVTVALATEDERKRVGRALVKAARPGHAIVFVPRGRKLGRDFAEVELDLTEQLGLSSWRAKMESAVAELEETAGPKSGVAAPVERTKDAAPKAAAVAVPKGVRIAVESTRVGERTRVIVNGEPCDLPDAWFPGFLFFVGMHLKKAGTWGTATQGGFARTKHVPSRIRTALRDAMPEGFVLIQSGGSGSYRLNTTVVIEAVDWEGLEGHPKQAVRTVAREYGGKRGK